MSAAPPRRGRRSSAGGDIGLADFDDVGSPSMDFSTSPSDGAAIWRSAPFASAPAAGVSGSLSEGGQSSTSISSAYFSADERPAAAPLPRLDEGAVSIDNAHGAQSAAPSALEALGDLALAPRGRAQQSVPGMGMDASSSSAMPAGSPAMTTSELNTPRPGASPRSSPSASPPVPSRRASLHSRRASAAVKAAAAAAAASTAGSSSSSAAQLSTGGLGIEVKPAVLPQLAPASARAPTGAMREKLQNWVLSVGCVTFDLDHGPELECLCPQLGISREERDMIAFSSFPDTSIFDTGTTSFSFRLREVPLIDPIPSPPPMPASAPATGTSRARIAGGKARAALGAHFFGDRSGSSSASGTAGGSSSSSPRGEDNDVAAGYMPLYAAAPRPESDDDEPPRTAPLDGEERMVFGRGRGRGDSSNYIYGYAFFCQKRDASIRRGYFQKSIVILSHLPYVALFDRVINLLGPLYFAHGAPMLEAFCQDVTNWPAPEPGATLSLPVLGSVLDVALPLATQAQSRETPTSPLPSPLPLQPGAAEAVILASIPATPLVSSFRELLPDMWLLWECVLLGEPILIVGPDPKQCSEAVWHLLDLIRPIPFGGDWRPFFTIHDYDFKTLVTRNKPQAGTLLGVTNPFMLQACSHWPHVLRVGHAAPKPSRHGSGTSAGGTGLGKRASAPPAPSTPVSAGGVAGGNSAGGGGPEHLAGFSSKRKRRISKDRALLKRLLELVERPNGGAAADATADALLRRYFADQTSRFLAPLNRYVSSLIPATFDLSSPSAAPQIRPFSTTAFLASLKAHGTPLAVRSRSLPTGAAVRQALYLDFLRSPNFGLWLQERLAAAEEEQWRRRVAVLEQGDVRSFAKQRGEVEALDLWTRLVAEIRSVDARLSSPSRPGPGSRWRSDTPAPDSSASDTPGATPAASSLGTVSDAQQASTRHAAKAASTSSQASFSSALTPASAGLGSINGGASGSSSGFEEASLLAHRARLTAQLERLGQTLSPDLQASLRLAA